MSKIRVEQWKNEPPDLLLLRAVAKILPHVTDPASRHAMWHYLWRRAEAELLHAAAPDKQEGK